MRTHNCSVELVQITFEGKCNWCGLDEFEEFTDEENEKTVDEYFAKLDKIEAAIREKNDG